ncbi:TlpA family protein disulfide reductase [Chloroflexota bacterium]
MNRLLAATLMLILTVGLLIAGCASSSTSGGSAQAPQVGKLAPDFQLLNLEGQSISLNDFRGSPVILNFWATWCSPCRAEMPFLQEIYEDWTGKSPSVAMLTINIKENSTRVKDFLETYNLSLPVLLDTDGNVSNKYNITGIPTTFFIDKDGIIQEKIVGAFRNKEQIEEHLGKIVP